MKRKSIHRKVLETILIISLAFGVTVSMVAAFQFYVQRRSINQANHEYATRLTQEASGQLTELNYQVAENLSAVYGAIIDENFKDTRVLAQSLAAYTGQLYGAGVGAGAEPEEEAAASRQDRMVGYMAGASPDAQRRELLAIGSVREYISSLAEYSPRNLDVLDIYVVTDTGMCLDGTGEEYEISEEYPELRNAEWYTGARDTAGPYWAKAFVGAATGIRKITCGVPFYDDAGKFRGVAAVDLAVEHLYDTALATRSGQVAHAILLDGDGNVMVNPDEYDVESMDIAEGVRIEDGGFISFVTIPETGWNLCMVFRFDMVNQTTQKIETIISENSAAVGSLMSAAISRSVVIFILTMAVCCAAVCIISRKLTTSLVTPIKRLTREVALIGEGNLDHQIRDIDTGDEIGILAEAFNHMTKQLGEYIANLAAVTAEKERIGAELSVATQIQASMLPCIFPAFPERAEFDIYASMQPAKEVGGDFYDFFLVDDDHLAIVVADVSGKGVPAALFMVIAKTLIKNYAQLGESPSAVFTAVNQKLCENNETGLFVTAWLGVLTISTGEIAYTNAGHNPPLVCKKDGSFEYLKVRSGFVLAGMEGMKYRQAGLKLDRGDMIYLYTDGVTEATDIHEELYGEERLLEFLNRNRKLGLQDLLDGVKKDIDGFVKGAPQFDDITMLGLRLNG